MSARILIAEDEESILLSLDFLMKRCGFLTRTVRDGEQALRALGDFQPHVVVLDVMLPRMNGLEVCRALRADPALLGTRVLMLTAKGGEDEIRQGLAAGADDYLVKPFATQELVAHVKALLADPVPGSLVRDGDLP